MKLEDIVIVKYHSFTWERGMNNEKEKVKFVTYIQGMVQDIVKSEKDGEYIVVNGTRIANKDIIDETVLL